MLIDTHVHLYPTEVDRDPAAWAEAHGEKHWALLCTRRRKDGRPVQSLPTIDGLLRAMDDAGIGRAVLLGWYWEKLETCVGQNRFYAQCVRAHPDRLSAFAALQPAAGFWPTLNEMHRARDDGLIGFGELSPHSQGYAIDDAVFREALVLASDWKMPVNLHVTDPESRAFPGRVETPLADFPPLAREFPKVPFILAHWGGLLPLRDASVLGLKNIFYDTAASPLLYDAGIWQRFTQVVPREQVLFGSDFPLNLYPRVAVEAEMARLVAEAREAGMSADVLGENAARLFFAAR
ncbi:MAG TPA: amidohydrolase family protein [Opitutaceae bacterium]|nr:amidohydrolase family protein [Opitutaceae bacterium]